MPSGGHHVVWVPPCRMGATMSYGVGWVRVEAPSAGEGTRCCAVAQDLLLHTSLILCMVLPDFRVLVVLQPCAACATAMYCMVLPYFHVLPVLQPCYCHYL